MATIIPEKIREEILRRDNFSCQKCGFIDNSGTELEIHHIDPRIEGGNEDLANLIVLCSICHNYVPDSIKEFDRYINEKIDGALLETFRKSKRSIASRTIKGMQNQFLKGNHITKAPRGYNLINKQLVINEQEAEQVKQIFEEFLNNDISLTQLAKKHNMTTAGLIKLLKNSTYLGKVKFARKESNGQHKPLISEELFNKVQKKLK